ncbi:MAG: hypothetical protein AAF599_05395 [Bacteroidota bacterium]
MQNFDLKLYYSGWASRLNCHQPKSQKDVSEQQNQKQPERALAEPDPNLSEKKPSNLISIILITATMSMYTWGIYQVTITAASLIQSMVQEVHQDSGLRRF